MRSKDQISVQMWVCEKEPSIGEGGTNDGSGTVSKFKKKRKKQNDLKSHFLSLNFGFFIYKMGIVLVLVLPTFQSLMRFGCENRL